MLSYYEQHGYEKTIKMAKEMMASRHRKKDMHFMTHTHGELCEVVAIVTVKEYMRNNPEKTSGWFYTHSTILKDPKGSRRTGFFTELDLTIFTPASIIALECKSYSGDKRLQDICTINVKGRKTDVFKQHRMHTEVLINNVDSARDDKTVPGYQLSLFNFSNGDIRDERSDQNKAAMLLSDENTLPNILDYFAGKPPVWDMKTLRKFMSIIESKRIENAKAHESYLKSLGRWNK